MIDLRPMLATSWADPFDDPGWLFEVKWDGYRCLAGSDGRTRMRSRNGIDLTKRFPGVAALEFPSGWLFDGEVVVFGDDGIPDFSLLQTGTGAATFVAFDVLIAADQPILEVGLEERKDILANAPLPDGVHSTEATPGTGRALFEVVKSRGLEGIVAKRVGSVYQPGRRSPDWRKVAVRRSVRAVVGGWLPGEGGRSNSFGSLLVGVYDGGSFRWVGAVGSGFSDDQLGPITAALHQLERDSPPFSNAADVPKQARWVKPGIVVQVEYKEWTRDLRLRAPVFKGIDDTDPEAVTWSAEGPDRPEG